MSISPDWDLCSFSFYDTFKKSKMFYARSSLCFITWKGIIIIMKKPNSTESVCPCCKRHCKSDNLHCLRGKIHFGQETDSQENPTDRHSHTRSMPDIKDETLALMLKCGHYLHHELTDENTDVLSFLSDNEKNELTKLLKKCIEQWSMK